MDTRNKDTFLEYLRCGDMESVFCDVINICLKKMDERESGKGNPKKEMDLVVLL